MKKPLVAIVGRPNVGKSTFFNKVVGKRISIVKDEPGVTRDRIYADAEWSGYGMTFVDTGGLDMKSKEDFQHNVTRQASLAIDLADVILFFVDGKYGLVADDYDVANFLRKYKIPVILVVNKIDNNEQEKIYEFYSLGLGEPIAISSEQNKGLGDLLDRIVLNFKNKVEPDIDNDKLKIAIVGKPNAGKSSIINRLIGEERVVVSDVAGTTRDAIDTPFRYNGKEYILIDTAGIRKKKNIDSDSVELYSVVRAFDAIRRADVVVMVIDAQEGITEQDTKIIGFVHEEGKPSVIVMNKWDLVEKDAYTMNSYLATLNEELKFMSYFIPLFVSAKTGQRLNKLMETVIEVYNNASYRIPTGALNEIIQNAVLVNQPPFYKGRKLKIYYLTQPQTNPPTFLLFVNDSKLIHFSYLRYIENCIRQAVNFKGTPIKIILKGKDENREK